MVWGVWSLKEEETQQLELMEQLKSEVSDIEFNVSRFGSGDVFFERWLKAKRHNVNETADAIRKYMNHRSEKELDTIHKWKLSDPLKDDLPYEITGFDNLGCPILFVPWGKWDMPKTINSGLGHEYTKRVLQMVEIVERKVVCQDETDKGPVPGYIVIADLNGFDLRSILSKSALAIIFELVKIMDPYHTTSLQAAYFCNVPRTFSYLWKLVKPMVRPEVREKVHFFSNISKLQASLQADGIPDSVVPTEIGGSYKTQWSSEEHTTKISC